MKATFALKPLSDQIARAKFFGALPRKCTWSQKSLIIPCLADRRKFIAVCAGAGRRNGDFDEKI